MSSHSPANQHFLLPVTFHHLLFPSFSTQVLIDSGASSNFIDQEFAKIHQIPTKIKKIPEKVECIDGSLLSSGLVTHETEPLLVQYGDHKEYITFYLITSAHFPVIFGISWLKLHNPTISWKENTCFFQSSYCSNHCFQNLNKETSKNLSLPLKNI